MVGIGLLTLSGNGKQVACLTKVSALSFLRMSECPGTCVKSKFIS